MRWAAETSGLQVLVILASEAVALMWAAAGRWALSLHLSAGGAVRELGGGLALLSSASCAMAH